VLGGGTVLRMDGWIFDEVLIVHGSNNRKTTNLHALCHEELPDKGGKRQRERKTCLKKVLTTEDTSDGL